MENEISEFFEMLVKKYINKYTLKYINMAVFRDDFITGTLKTIEDYNINRSISEDALIEAVWDNISFCKLFPTAENESIEFIISMSNKYFLYE